MSEAKGYPANQPFCIKGKKNLTKKNAWWQHEPYHNNGVNRSNKPKTQGE